MAENMFEISPDGKTLKVVTNGGYQETMVVPDGVQKIAKEAFSITRQERRFMMLTE